jgi:hypothetical protein
MGSLPLKSAEELFNLTGARRSVIMDLSHELSDSFIFYRLLCNYVYGLLIYNTGTKARRVR